jgi:charged multivesicular body protein 3
MVKVTGAFQKSTVIMKSTNQLVKLPELSATMRQMSMEMTKVGFNILPWLTSVRDHGGDAGRHYGHPG